MIAQDHHWDDRFFLPGTNLASPVCQASSASLDRTGQVRCLLTRSSSADLHRAFHNITYRYERQPPGSYSSLASRRHRQFAGQKGRPIGQYPMIASPVNVML